MPLRRRPFCTILIAALLLARPACAVEQAATGGSSGLPVPRFVSLKSDRVHVRGGPSRDHEVAWMFIRSGLPVEVTAESIYEAAALGVSTLKSSGWVDAIASGTELEIEVREPAT